MSKADLAGDALLQSKSGQQQQLGPDHTIDAAKPSCAKKPAQ